MKARDNPFAMARLERVAYRLEGVTHEALLQRFDALGRRAALVGVHGSGKTTLAAELAAHWRSVGRRVLALRLSSEERRLAPGLLERQMAGLGTNDVVLLDGAEQLGWWGWRQFLRRTHAAGGLLITTHRPGRLPTLLECRTTPDLLAGLVRELAPTFDLRAAGAGDPAVLYWRHRGNLRDALRELYDRCSRSGPSDSAGPARAERA